MPCKPDRPARENFSPSASDNIRKAASNSNEPKDSPKENFNTN